MCMVHGHLDPKPPRILDKDRWPQPNLQAERLQSSDDLQPSWNDLWQHLYLFLIKPPPMLYLLEDDPVGVEPQDLGARPLWPWNFPPKASDVACFWI